MIHLDNSFKGNDAFGRRDAPSGVFLFAHVYSWSTVSLPSHAIEFMCSGAANLMALDRMLD
jgi:hypothetical protein